MLNVYSYYVVTANWFTMYVKTQWFRKYKAMQIISPRAWVKIIRRNAMTEKIKRLSRFGYFSALQYVFHQAVNIVKPDVFRCNIDIRIFKINDPIYPDFTGNLFA